MKHLLAFGFGEPAWLLLLALVPVLAWLQGRAGRVPAISFSAVSILQKISAPARRNPWQWMRHPGWIVLTLCILAMARPRVELGTTPEKKEGVDIVFCVDVSGSMDSEDFVHQGQRISKRKALVLAISEFVDRRPNDRFGMIGFAGNTYLMSPLTLDGEWIKSVLLEIQTQANTAIGEGIVTSVDLLKQSKSRSRIIVVVTDGANNYGIPPLEAAEFARKEKIRVHTIQIMQPKEVRPENVKGTLGQIANNTGGLYFQAATLDGIMGVYRQIDQMEKTNFEQKKFRVYDELYPWLVLPAGLIFLLGWVGQNTLWLRIP